MKLNQMGSMSFFIISLFCLTAVTSFVKAQDSNVEQLCSSGEQAMDSVCQNQCLENQIAINSDECALACQFSKSYFFSRCRRLSEVEISGLLKTVCEYVAHYGYSGDFLSHCEKSKAKRSEEIFCEAGREALDSVCNASCVKSNITFESELCKTSCEFSKSYFFEKCDSSNEDKIRRTVLPAVCPYLYSFGYKGSFLDYCQNILIGHSWVEEFCNQGNQALTTACVNNCLTKNPEDACIHCKTAGDKVFGSECLTQPEKDIRQRMAMFCEMVGTSTSNDVNKTSFLNKYCQFADDA